ncbi:MAG: hypothetical protein ABIS67_07685 [Candidatus Eisenbacteria bacterium]
MDRTPASAGIGRGFLARALGILAPVPVLLATFLTFNALAGCSAQPASSRRDLTQRQRDSTLGRSVIAGAGTVGRALRESDRAGAAAHALDAQVDSLAR